MNRVLAVLVCCTIAIVVPRDVHSQAGEEVRRAGLPYFSEHYSPGDYRAHHQNFGIVQDHRGIIYVANVNGVLEFDGVTWRTIPTPAAVLSLAVDDDGTIYAGLHGDVGYLAPTERGELRYTSLSRHLPRSHREIGRIWTTSATPQGIYFQSREHILRWDGAKFKAWNASGVFHKAFSVGGRYFVREQEVGLQEIRGESLELVDGGELFANDQIWFMVQLGTEVVLGSRDRGLIAWSEGEMQPIVTGAADYLRRHRMQAGTVLPGAHLAIATVSGGVVVIGQDGHVVDALDPSRGLPDTRVNHVFADAQGGLWMVFNSQGLMRADIVSPLTLFNDVLGLQGAVFSMHRRAQSLYVATGAGLYEVDLVQRQAIRVGLEDPSVSSRLTEVWDSESFGSDLLLATTKGVLRLDTENRLHEITRHRTFAVQASSTYPGALYVGTAGGLELIRQQGEAWERDDRLPHIGAEVREIVEEAGGTVWFRGGDGGLYRVTAPVSGPIEIRTFGDADGLPPGRFGVTSVAGAVAIVHGSGVYRYRGPGYNPAFRRDEAFDAPWSTSADHLYALSEDNRGNVWIVYGDRTDILTPSENGYRFTSPDALRLRNEGTGVVDVYVETSGIAWLSYGSNVLRYDPAQDRSYDFYYQALIRRVNPIGERWNVYGGADLRNRQNQDAAPRHVPRLVYEYNALRFEVAAPSFNNPGQNEFRYMLEPHDASWSDWTPDPVVEYANLREGNYTLRVRARNSQGFESTEGLYRFLILPPWYRTWWAYLVYAAAFVAAVGLSIHYRRMRQDNIQARQQARELALERVVNERLTLVNDRLRQADLLKDQLLSNTSHELRTPITAILGFTSVLKDEAPHQFQEFLDIIEENGHRLMRTVTSMVDFARLQAGVIELKREPVEVSREVEQVVSRLAHLARKRRLYFELIQPRDLIHAWLDKKCLERIVENLLTNAIKFTEEGGVTVRVSADDDSVFVRVEDTGIGMTSDFLPELFKAFKQESSGLTRTHEGSGLGLAITARLVELMEGEIDVKSSKGDGTVVTVSFPIFYVSEPDRAQKPRSVSRSGSA